jgi:hypothetical protein
VDDRTTPLEETLQTLADFVQEGKVRYLGWSNVRTWRLERIRGLCAANGWPQPVALRADLSLVAYSPLLKGLYDGSAAERPGHPGMEPYAGDAAARRLAMVDAVTAETGGQPRQVVLAGLSGAALTPGTPADRHDQGSCHAVVTDLQLARQVLAFPEDRDWALLLSLGYPADRPLAPIKSSARRPFDDVVHHGRGAVRRRPGP